ncbi:MAG: hypothetical protein GC136_03700 [Alphaproteobacteria bacterium]|nr:hypothetical protein [Alphaproteobacteria bacterium]
MTVDILKEPLRLRTIWSHVTDPAVVLDSAVSVVGEKGAASGFLIAPQIVVTAEHVMQGMEASAKFVKYGQPEIALVRHCLLYPYDDIAVVLLDRVIHAPCAVISESATLERGSPVAMPNVRPLGDSEEEALLWAQTQRHQDAIKEGSLELKIDNYSAVLQEEQVGLKGRFNVFSCACAEGNSGAAIFDARTNKVISVACIEGDVTEESGEPKPSVLGLEAGRLYEITQEATVYFEQKYGVA